jgi:mycothiol synthase
MASLRRSPTGDTSKLATGLTGVRREWRRQGIALALKIAGLHYAREHGYTTVTTSNASNNDPILALNRQLGFVREPWRIHLVKELEGNITA